MIGQGPERINLERLALSLGIADRIDWFGFVDRHVDVLKTIAGASMFVSASEIEGFGIAVVEAMALGVPYAVSDIPAFREVTAGGTGGVLYTPGEPSALASAVREVLTDPADQAERRVAGKRHARRFTWSAIAEATSEVLHATIAGAATARPTRVGD